MDLERKELSQAEYISAVFFKSMELKRAKLKWKSDRDAVSVYNSSARAAGLPEKPYPPEPAGLLPEEIAQAIIDKGAEQFILEHSAEQLIKDEQMALQQKQAAETLLAQISNEKARRAAAEEIKSK